MKYTNSFDCQTPAVIEIFHDSKFSKLKISEYILIAILKSKWSIS